MQSPLQRARLRVASLQPHTFLVAFCSWDLCPLPFCRGIRHLWAHKSVFQLHGSSVCLPRGHYRAVEGLVKAGPASGSDRAQGWKRAASTQSAQSWR